MPLVQRSVIPTVIPDSNPMSASPIKDVNEVQRRSCGCVKTSEKLRNILKMFPQAPPPTPCNHVVNQLGVIEPDRAGKEFLMNQAPMPNYYNYMHDRDHKKLAKNDETCMHKTWIVVKELVSLIQLSVTATALAIYYIIYCYMQLIYFTLRSAMYFHHSDVSMKITLAIIIVTTLVIGLNFLARFERLIGFK